MFGCVFGCLCSFTLSMFEFKVIRGRTRAFAHFSLFFSFFFFSRGHKFSFNWVVYRKDH